MKAVPRARLQARALARAAATARYGATLACALVAGMLLASCASTPPAGLQPVELVKQVDVTRYAGDWYVIANIPTFIEKGAHNARERYALQPDGTMNTTFSFRADAFDGPLKEYHSRGIPEAPGSAVWGQQYIWPFKADYRISYLASDYSEVVVTREKRDYVWIMARTPQIPEADLQKLIAYAGTQGYDVAKIQRVPQQPR